MKELQMCLNWKMRVEQIWKNPPQVRVNSVLKALIEGKGFECMKSYHTQAQKNTRTLKKMVQEQASFKVSKKLMSFL